MEPRRRLFERNLRPRRDRGRRNTRSTIRSIQWRRGTVENEGESNVERKNKAKRLVVYGIITEGRAVARPTAATYRCPRRQHIRNRRDSILLRLGPNSYSCPGCSRQYTSRKTAEGLAGISYVTPSFSYLRFSSYLLLAMQILMVNSNPYVL